MTELANRVWWPFCIRDLLNRSRLCKSSTDLGKNLKAILPSNKFKRLTPCVEPNQEIQLDFAGPIYDGQKKEIYIFVCIDRFSNCPTAKFLKKTPNAPNVERFLLKYFRIHKIPLQIRLDRARWLLGNTAKILCEKKMWN